MLVYKEQSATEGMVFHPAHEVVFSYGSLLEQHSTKG